MSAKFELTAESREAQGTGASRRLRHAGRVPAVMYGAGKPVRMLTLDQHVIKRHLDNEKFHTAILTVKVGGEEDQAILRDWQMHPWQPVVMHVDFQRINPNEKLHMRIPFHFTGADIAPGVKQQGGIVAHLMSEVDITCLPKDLPEFLGVDVSGLHIGESLHLSDLKLPEGVQVTSLTHGGGDLAVVTVTHIKVVEEVAPVAAVEAAPAEGAAAAPGAAAPAEGEKKPAADAAKKPEAGKKPEAKK